MLLAALLAFAGCTEVTTYYGLPADQVHGQRVLLLEASLVDPTPEAMQSRLQAQVREALQASPDVGEVLDGAAVRRRPGLALETLDAYDQFSNTLSLAGIPDPELSHRLHKDLGIGLLVVVQPVLLPCPPCEQGDELWVVGQLVEADTGKLAFRAHLQTRVDSSDATGLAEQADALTREYLEQQSFAFQLRPHRVRFNHLRKLAEG